MKRLFVSLYIIIFFTGFALPSFSQWTQIGSGQIAGNVLVFYTSDGVLYAGGAALYKSTDNGLNWENMYVPVTTYITGIAKSGNYMYVSTYSDLIYKSTNGGISWQQLINTAPGHFTSIAADGANVYASWYAYGFEKWIYFSADFGDSWQVIAGGIYNSLHANGADIYAAKSDAPGGLYKINNGVVSSLGFSFPAVNLDINGTQLFAVTQSNGVYYSSNSGANWELRMNGIPATASINSVESEGSFIIAGSTVSGIYNSVNSGNSWVSFSEGLNGSTVTALEVNLPYTFAGLNNGTVWKRDVSYLTGISGNTENAVGYKLGQNYPNPFNPSTEITFTLPEKSNVELTISDITGKTISNVISGEYTMGTHKINFNAPGLSSGIYFYRLSTPKFTETRKMLLVK